MKQVTHPDTGEVLDYTNEGFLDARDKALLNWQKLKGQLDAIKEAEMKARKMAVAFIRENTDAAGKIQNVDLGYGYKAKYKIPVNYNFVKDADNKTDRATIEKALQKIESDGPVGELLAERLIKWEPRLSVSEYNKLDSKYRKIIDNVIVTSEGSPTLEIVEPKDK